MPDRIKCTNYLTLCEDSFGDAALPMLASPLSSQDFVMHFELEFDEPVRDAVGLFDPRRAADPPDTHRGTSWGSEGITTEGRDTLVLSNINARSGLSALLGYYPAPFAFISNHLRVAWCGGPDVLDHCVVLLARFTDSGSRLRGQVFRTRRAPASLSAALLPGTDSIAFVGKRVR